jgi:uncharacterized repeat protein (TIGR01451 family)
MARVITPLALTTALAWGGLSIGVASADESSASPSPAATQTSDAPVDGAAAAPSASPQVTPALQEQAPGAGSSATAEPSPSTSPVSDPTASATAGTASPTPIRVRPDARVGAQVLAAVDLPPSGSITLPACDGATSTASGVDNTPGAFVLPDGSTAANDLRAGKTVFLYDGKGFIVTRADGTYVGTGARVPYCGAKLNSSGKVTVDWRFCTDESLGGCATEPPSVVPSNSKLTATQAGQIAHLLHNADLSTKRARSILQIQIWCISESRAPGTAYSGAIQYFNSPGRLFNDTDPANPESAYITTAEATCADVPVLPQTPTLEVSGPTSPVAIGSPATFRVTANFAGPIDLALSGVSSLQLCPSNQAGVSLSGLTLTLAQPATVTVCATRTTPGRVSLSASADGIAQADQLTYANAGSSCQVFADYAEGSTASVSASAAQAEFFAVSVGDYVWWDTNRDGLQDTSEAPVPGVTVHLLDEAGSTIATTTTSSTGYYEFTDLIPDTRYSIEFVRPDGTSWTLQNAAGQTDNDASSDTKDSDANTSGPQEGQVAFTSPAHGDNQGGPGRTDNPSLDAGLVRFNLTLTKSLVTSGTVHPGDVIAFELVPANDGPSDALPGWSVSDLVPAGTTFVSASGAGYVCAEAVCTADAGLAAGAHGAPITVTVRIDADVVGTIRNVAYVSPSPKDVPETNPLVVPDTDTDTDTTPTDNDAQASVTVHEVTPADHPGTTTGSGGDELAYTGAGDVGILGSAAAVALVAGALLLLVRRGRYQR